MVSGDETPGTYSACPACGDARLSPLDAYAAAHLVRCERCGLTFAGRRPTGQELEAHYSGYGDWPDSALTRLRYREVLAAFEPYRSVGRIFDMGCGAGYFLEEAAAAGWEPHGSTVGALSVEMCRAKGLAVVDAADADTALPDAYFDVATAFEVVEHLADPAAEAKLLARVVRPGGLLYCTTPNFNSLSRRMLGPRWRVIDYPEHLIYFTAKTLKTWLAPFGFRPIRVESTGLSPGELRRALRTGREATAPTAAPSGAGAVRGIDDRLRQATESGRLLPMAKRTLNSALTATGTGDTLKLWFVREPA
jgi:2-polyprenyl-3-methyl-5-hydroxy-6-metoxy-1,4-benzoquinol methylase